MQQSEIDRILEAANSFASRRGPDDQIYVVQELSKAIRILAKEIDELKRILAER
ncbi:hypothetical protein [Chromobacterium subtsugae]|uniref:hypothetical protein n=1 Tax=Chromobacterium subtsugae TaxID=251747 RepID=UPI000A7D4A58|nr:hypothetical protein [Chromobacterium subtsugae]